MCLGAIATVVETWDEGGVPMARVDDGHERSAACLLYVPEAEVGDRVLVHLGFVVERLDPSFADDALRLRAEMGP